MYGADQYTQSLNTIEYCIIFALYYTWANHYPVLLMNIHGVIMHMFILYLQEVELLTTTAPLW